MHCRIYRRGWEVIGKTPGRLHGWGELPQFDFVTDVLTLFSNKVDTKMTRMRFLLFVEIFVIRMKHHVV